jgi:hypothetical protein
MFNIGLYNLYTLDLIAGDDTYSMRILETQLLNFFVAKINSES